MKIRKNISKMIGLSLFMSNFSIYSGIATYNDEIPNRYETLEGEYLTIDDSTEGEIKSIEILGNTVQDENNLEDIQSVGDLYVDENGNPILDSQGREQYKIEIVSTGKNLFNGNLEIGDILNTTGEKSQSNNCVRSADYIKVKPSSYIVLSNNMGYANYIYEYDNNKNFLKLNTKDTTNVILLSEDTEYVMFRSMKTRYQNDLSVLYQLEFGERKTTYEPYQENKLTILSPTPLEKVGDIADRIICRNGVWGVEKNIRELVLNGNENWSYRQLNGTFYFYQVQLPFNTKNRYDDKLITNKYVTNLSWDEQYEYCFVNEYNGLVVNSSISTLDEFKNSLKAIPLQIYYQVVTPQFMPLPNSQQLKLCIFVDKTHIFSQIENGVNPTLKVTVDRLDRMALDAVDEVEVNPTIENLNTARNLVNHMNESDLKEELQQRLNEITDLNDLQLERKTSTSNVDIYIKSENMLSMALSTNSITFEDYSGLDDLEQSNAIKISINSSLPYQLNSYLVSEIQNADGSKIIDKDKLNIKDNRDTDYKTFTNINEKLILKDNCLAGNDLTHTIDFMLSGGNAYPSDIYKTVIKFEAEQK